MDQKGGLQSLGCTRAKGQGGTTQFAGLGEGGGFSRLKWMDLHIDMVHIAKATFFQNTSSCLLNGASWDRPHRAPRRDQHKACSMPWPHMFISTYGF